VGSVLLGVVGSVLVVVVVGGGWSLC
jgi:hypothetical protein